LFVLAAASIVSHVAEEEDRNNTVEEEKGKRKNVRKSLFETHFICSEKFFSEHISYRSFSEKSLERQYIYFEIFISKNLF